MIRNIAAVAVILLLGACQTTGVEDKPTYTGSPDDEAAVLNLAQHVCVENLGDGEAMNAAARNLTNDIEKRHTAKSGGHEIPVQSYRYTKDGKYLAYVSILWDGEACSVNYAERLVRPSVFQSSFDVVMTGGIYEGAIYGKSQNRDMAMVVSKSRGEDGPVMSVGFMNKEAYRKEQSLTGAPDLGWDG